MSKAQTTVHVRRESVTLPTYLPQPPSTHPMFLERRVYQGSSGRVYPLPVYDRIAEEPQPHAWDAIHLENDYVYVMILPEIGGRIHTLRDKTNGYDAVYHQDVIKPALVALAGPWISGGIEFNWPQHHRPATFMPVTVSIETAPDGSVTVWCSDHDPMSHMKGMHGVCLHPDRSVVELKVRAYNRTTDTQTFLWWANTATRVHQNYESFFPADGTYVADHAKRATSTFPLCDDHYYGVNYGERARKGVPASEQPRLYPPAADLPANNLAWYANIPVPTSYMCMGSREDFFGGYDHQAKGGLIHIASHHISPGKKQWTWGNHEFGYAWDRNLTDANAAGEYPPYIELMAGVYTDNQPDFSFLQPGETKTWQQYWYPIRDIGPARKANCEAAISLSCKNSILLLGVAATRPHINATVTLFSGDKKLAHWQRDIAPEASFVVEFKLPRGARFDNLVVVVASEGRELLRHAERSAEKTSAPPPATEPQAPADIVGTDELYITGLHLEQYRHATRMPEAYWREALRRDPGDSRCLLALGRWHLRRGEFSKAEDHLRRSIARLTLRNPNPADGEALYQLGLCLRFLNRDDDAYDALYKATWNQAWASAGFHALAEIDCARHDWNEAIQHLERALRLNTDNLRARALLSIALSRQGREAEANAALERNRALDPLDAWTQHLSGNAFPGDTQTRLDVAHDFARAGLFKEAIKLLEQAHPEAVSGTAPLVAYTLAWLHARTGDNKATAKLRRAGQAANPDYCFPARLEEILVLRDAIEANPRDGRTHYYLGNLYYDRKRHEEAIAHWRKASVLEPGFAIVWRNLGIGYFNVLNAPDKARAAYDRAVKAAPNDARLLYERDQLWKRLGKAPAARLRTLKRSPELIRQRDDLSVEYCALLNQTGRESDALAVLQARRFQPWEGGEGQASGQYKRALLGLGRRALHDGDAAEARVHFEAALQIPENLGEAKHLLANQSDILLALGDACAALGDKAAAHAHWTQAATFRGDFQNMSVRAFSEMTFHSILAWQRLGRAKQAREQFKALRAFAQQLRKQPAKIDYFATSLPTMLLFNEDLDARQLATSRVIEAQALIGLGQKKAARVLLGKVLAQDPNHDLAHELLAATPARS